MGRTLDDLGTRRLTWYDLKVLAKDLLARHDTALFRELNGVYWSVEGQLLAVVADALHVGNWQRGGKKSAPKPKPIKRPWEKLKGTVVGKNPIPISKFNDWWDSKVRPQATTRRKAKAERKPLSQL